MVEIPNYQESRNWQVLKFNWLRCIKHLVWVAFLNLFLQEFKDTPIYDHVEKLKLEEKMPTERCAKLMVVSMANNLDEVWIAEHPVLFFYYLSQYFPNLFKWYVRICLKFNVLEIWNLSKNNGNVKENVTPKYNCRKYLVMIPSCPGCTNWTACSRITSTNFSNY